jgi:hypothetical protein
MKKEEDWAKAFDQLKNDTYHNINGILVEKGINHQGVEGFKWAGQFYESIDDLKQEMNGLSSLINLSIINPNGEVKRLEKVHTNGYYNGKSPYTLFKESERLKREGK